MKQTAETWQQTWQQTAEPLKTAEPLDSIAFSSSVLHQPNQTAEPLKQTAQPLQAAEPLAMTIAMAMGRLVLDTALLSHRPTDHAPAPSLGYPKQT